MTTVTPIPTGTTLLRPTTREESLRCRWRQSVVRRARDVTDAAATRARIVLAPHPDDETLGCGATIARKRAHGTRVIVVIATDGRYSHPYSNVLTANELRRVRAAEAVAAAARLGVPREDVLLVGHEDGHLRLWTREVAALIVELCRAERPDEILVPSHLDDNPDHVALNHALRLAVPRLAHRSRVLEYPVWYWVHGPWRALGVQHAVSRQWRLLVDPVSAARQRQAVAVRTEHHLDAKRSAIAEYASQFTNLTGEPDWAVLDHEFVGHFVTEREIFFPWNDREV